MSKIRILPEQLANQIAAGEVVERPASVVKELLENSLDAGADRIEIEIEGGGTRLIRIIDNGMGMDEDDVLLSLERHGTSKIQTESDLTTINTLGFRGEAIPSIGSVSQMTITSRPADAELGTRAVLIYGKLTKVHEIGCSRGTIFEVKNLFGNTPARRKFLRTVRTELSHIDEVVKNYALGTPDVTFILTIDGKQSLYLDNTLSLEQRLGQIMHYKGTFIHVGNPAITRPERRAYGFLVPPEQVTTGPAKLRLFVNGRAIKDRMLTHAIAEGLRGFLMKGKNPAGLIHLLLPPDEVDVNVHPAKHEVRFRNSREVHFLLTRTVTEAMQNEQRKLQRTLFGKDCQSASTTIPLEQHRSTENPFSPPASSPKPAESATAPTAALSIPATTRAPRPPESTLHRPAKAQASTTKPEITLQYDQTDIGLTTNEPILGTPETPAPIPPARPAQPQQIPLAQPKPTGHGLQIVGQFEDLYIFCKNSEGLLVIDQHAAHERLIYEELREQYLNNKVSRQNLLFPETVELSIFQAQLVEKHTEELEHMGFAIREFGGNSYIISAIPALAGQCSATNLLLDILEQFGSENRRIEGGGTLDSILSSMACRAAVKAGTALSQQEIDALLNKMARADLFSHCPHGRPVVKQFSKNEVKKWFYRT